MLAVDEEALGPGAVLAARLEGAPQTGREGLVVVGVIADDEGVLPAQLHHHGGLQKRASDDNHPMDKLATDRAKGLHWQVMHMTAPHTQLRMGWASNSSQAAQPAPHQVGGGSLHDLPPHDGGPDKDDLVHAARHQGVPRVPVPRDDLHEALGGAARLQRGADDAHVVLGAPRGVLRDLDDDGVAGKHGGREGVEDVVEGVVEGHDGTDDAVGVVLDTRRLRESKAGPGIA